MPQIDQTYLDCSIYLYDSKLAAEDGENFGGSGCLVSIHPPPVFDPTYNRVPRRVLYHLPPHVYAVTNRHVIEQGFPVIRLNLIDGQSDALELEVDDWFLHPDGDDLAVAPIDLPENKHDYISISPVTFVHQHMLGSDVGAGADVFMVGRFVSHAGKQRNTPSLRFGSIAMLPFEKVRLQNGFMQEAFLVETRSISGYSGSPVFVYKPRQVTATIPPSPDNPYAGETFVTSIADPVGYPMFLGIDCGHVRDREPILDANGQPHPFGWHVDTNTGMAIVIPAWRLLDLLNKPELVMQREEKDEQHRTEKEADRQSSSVAFDVKKKPGDITRDDYMEVLRRASRKISSQPESESDET
jgi:hypothetical protein